jgi:hypothetical protein
MNNSEEKTAMDFWYEYDDYFLFHAPMEIQSALQKVDPYGQLVELFRVHVQNNTLDTEFKSAIQENKEYLRLLSSNVIRIIDKFFDGKNDLQQKAFELFAQGLLFDNGVDDKGQPRRPSGDKIHMMDSNVLGYVVWHAFMRAVNLLDLDTDKDTWLQLDRHIGLGAAILSRLIKEGRGPQQSDDPNTNKPIEDEMISELRKTWLDLNYKDIDSKITQLEQPDAQVMTKHGN